MLCPVCQVELKIVERQGIEIDSCPRCRGVWLDRGELDKIVERSAARSSWEVDDDAPWHAGERPRDRRKKRTSFLGELFDFD